MSVQAVRAIPRLVPVVTPRSATRLPLFLMFGYVVATFLLFLIWPINWPIYTAADWTRLVSYVTLCFLAIGASAYAGSSGPTRVTAPLPGLRTLLFLGAAAAGLLLTPSCLAYTDRAPWQLLSVLGDQGAAYRRLQAQLLETAGQRNTIVILRTIAAPLTYAVLPLGLLHWRTIGWAGRACVGVVALSSMIFSIMRGTDKEMADLLLGGASAACVMFGRNRALGRDSLQLVRRYWGWGLVGVVFLVFAQGLFAERKEQRLGGFTSRSTICANDSRICADLDTPWIAWMPQQQKFASTMFILSTCSGYYGLELALEKPFDSALGVGHSPAALSVYEAVTGDKTLHLRTFTWRNGAEHWSEEHYWSTLITWIANDVGFVGAVVVLAAIGWLWGLWWREASSGFSDPAVVLFSLTTTMIFYLPANNQVFGAYEGYTVFGVWIGVWLWHRSNRALSAKLAAGPDRAR